MHMSTGLPEIRVESNKITLTGSRSSNIASVTNITGPITVDSSDSKGVVSRAAQSSDGGSTVSDITLFRWTHKPRGTGHLHQIVQYTDIRTSCIIGIPL